MTLETAVFVRIMQEKDTAAINAVEETMHETVRFGSLPQRYIRPCAEDRYKLHLKNVSNGG